MLDQRLSAVANMVPRVGVAADIGADHGKLSEYLLDDRRVEQLWVCDISAPSLAKARARLEDERFADRVHFGVGDGLAVVPLKPDCVIIAGMGARTIAGIISAQIEKVRASTLVLQANVDEDELREFLMVSGFSIADEELIYDGRWWYAILRAVPGRVEYDARQLLAGPKLLEQRHPLLPEYARRQARITQAALRTLAPDHSRHALLEKRLNIWKDIAACP